MTLLQSALASQLATAFSNSISGTHPDPTFLICATWGEYFKSSQLAGAPPLPAAVDAGVLAMRGAMNFANGSSPETGAAVFAAGLSAFWSHVQLGISSYWPGSFPGSPPPGLASIGSTLVSNFVSNSVQETTTAQAAQNLATAIHLSAGLGGTGTIGVVVTPIL